MPSPHITRLAVENIKKLRTVEITPDGRVITISGKNDSGKSSILDAIWMALGGAKAAEEVPIRQGEKTARVKLELGDLIITRTYSEKGSVLKVETAEGFKMTSPQNVLDQMLGDSLLNFDPLAFERMKPADQAAELEKVSPLPAAVPQWRRDRLSAFAERTNVNRDLKAAEAIFETMKPPPVPEIGENVDDLIAQLASVSEKNAAVRAEIDRRRTMVEKAQDLITEAAQLRHRADELERRSHEMTAEYAALPPAGEEVNVEALRDRVGFARARQAEAERYDREMAAFKAAEKRVGELRLASESLTAQIESHDREIAKAISEAPMPIPGLSYATDEGQQGLLFNGVPFAQASKAQRIRAALAIAMAKRSKVRIVRIADGSLLDDESVALIEQMAEAYDYQVWMEVVDGSGKLGIVMVDGEVAENSSNG